MTVYRKVIENEKTDRWSRFKRWLREYPEYRLKESVQGKWALDWAAPDTYNGCGTVWKRIGFFDTREEAIAVIEERRAGSKLLRDAETFTKTEYVYAEGDDRFFKTAVLLGLLLGGFVFMMVGF